MNNFIYMFCFIMIDNLDSNIVSDIEYFLDKNIDNFISTTIFSDNKCINDLLYIIKNKLKLKNFPYKVICIDISHNNWQYPVWWISVMVWWILSKKNYRKIKIPNELWWNDYKSLKYCILKYFKNNSADLVILDWWIWQLNIIDYLPNEIVLNTDFISIWKWNARFRKWKIYWNKEYFYNKNFKISIDYSLFEDRLLIKLRDEAHRFANNYRLKLKSLDFT